MQDLIGAKVVYDAIKRTDAGHQFDLLRFKPFGRDVATQLASTQPAA